MTGVARSATPCVFQESSRHMLQGCTAWPEDFARRYRQQGYWSDITLNDMLRRSAAAAPDRIALVHGTRRMSYAQLVSAIDRLAGRLIELGFKPLDRVVFQLPNSIDFVIAFFALLRIGVIPVLALAGASARGNLAHLRPHQGDRLFRARAMARLRLSRAGRGNIRPGAVAAQRARARRARSRSDFIKRLARAGRRRARRQLSPHSLRRPMKSR